MPLITDHRPQTFDEIVGNAEAVKSLKTTMAKTPKSKIPHSYLFTGETGCGKTTTARIVAKHLGAKSLGIIEKNIANESGVDAIRDLELQTQHKSVVSPITVIILDEVHQLSSNGQNALLKLLEEPKPFVYVILATTNPEKLVDTLKNRCYAVHFGFLDQDDLITLLMKVIKAENLQADPVSLEHLVVYSGGSPRMLLTLLERCSGVLMEPENVQQICSQSALQVRDGDFPVASNMFGVMLNSQNADDAWRKLQPILKNDILGAKLKTDGIKDNLVNIMGRFLVNSPQPRKGMAETIVYLNSCSNVYTNGAFVGMIYVALTHLYKTPNTGNPYAPPNPEIPR